MNRIDAVRSHPRIASGAALAMTVTTGLVVALLATSSHGATAPPVSAFENAPRAADAAQKFGSLDEYLASPAAVRFAGKRQGVDWYFGDGRDSNVCLLSEDSSGNTGAVCTPAGDADPTHLHLFRDTAAGDHVSAAVVPDGFSGPVIANGAGIATLASNLLVVKQTADVTVKVADATGHVRVLDLPDLIVRHHAAAAQSR
jgi:hypothetical protein